MIDETLRDKLLGALKVAVSHVNTGDDPNAAVSKAASDADFNAEQTNRLCELFNTARTIYHFEHNPNEKSAEFDLADKDVVANTVFGGLQHKQSDARLSPLLMPDYGEYDGMELDARNGKVAAALPDLPVSAELDLPGIEDQSARLMKIVRSQRKMAEHAFSEARCAREKAEHELRKLGSTLCNSHLVHGTSKYARMLRCYDGKPGYQPVLDLLATHMPDYMDVDTAQLKKVGAVVDDRDLASECAMVSNIRSMLEGAAAIEALGSMTQKAANDALQQFENLVAPIVKGAERGEFDDFFVQGVKEGQTSISTERPEYSMRQLLEGAEPDKAKVNRSIPGTSEALKSTIEAAKGVGLGLDRVIGHGEEDFNKKLTERLRNQQREVMLGELMTKDPFITDADPQAVAAIYTQIMQLAPEVSLNKEIVRAILRQSLHNVTAVSPFDASSWADLEKTIGEVRGTLPARNTAGMAPSGGGKR